MVSSCDQSLTVEIFYAAPNICLVISLSHQFKTDFKTV